MTFTTYANTGPFTNNAVPPGINATFLNNVENFLDQIVSSAVADSHITSDGSGNETAVSLTLTAAGTGLTVQHNATVSGTMTISGAGTGLSVAHNATISGTLSVPGTLAVGTVNSGAVTANSVSFTQGSIARIAFGFSAVTTGGTTITHGLGVVPSAVLITPSTSGITFYVNS